MPDPSSPSPDRTPPVSPETSGAAAPTPPEALPVDDELGGTFEDFDAIVAEVSEDAGFDVTTGDDDLAAVLDVVEQSLEDSARDAEDPLSAASFETTEEALADVGAAPVVSSESAASADADGAHRSERAPDADANLRRMDAALAGDVDDLISGSFDTVHDVLSEVFEEEELSAVGHDGEDVFITADLEELRADDDLLPRFVHGSVQETPVNDDSSSGAVRPSEALSAALTPDVHDERPAPTDPDAAEVVARTPVGAADGEPIGASADDDARPVDAARADVSAPEAVERTVAPARQEPPARQADPVPDSLDVEPSSGGSARHASLHAAWRTIEPPLVVLLGAMNLPVRRMPARFRPIVDWVALSLVFWVPIVWIVALFVIGR